MKPIDNFEPKISFRYLLFARIVAILKDIDLIGLTMGNACDDIGVLGFAEVDLDPVMAHHEQIATEIHERWTPSGGRHHVSKRASTTLRTSTKKPPLTQRQIE